MARLQILELPEGSGDDRPPFILVVDECVPQRIVLGADAPYRDYWQDLAQQIGARGVIVTPETVDIPANDTTAYLGDREVRNEVTVKLGDQDVRSAIAADMNKARQQAGLPTIGQQLADERTGIARDTDRLAKRRDELADALGIDRTSNWDSLIEKAATQRQDRDEARSWARHGYEIGQKHCSWTDHGVAPEWLTEGWPPHIDSCQHLKHAAVLDEALSSIRSVHAPVEHRGQIICKECSGLDPEGGSTDNAPVLHEQCRTSRIACTAQAPDA
jgi:hypothetical protein